MVWVPWSSTSHTRFFCKHSTFIYRWLGHPELLPLIHASLLCKHRTVVYRWFGHLDLLHLTRVFPQTPHGYLLGHLDLTHPIIFYDGLGTCLARSHTRFRKYRSVIYWWGQWFSRGIGRVYISELDRKSRARNRKSRARDRKSRQLEKKSRVYYISLHESA